MSAEDPAGRGGAAWRCRPPPGGPRAPRAPAASWFRWTRRGGGRLTAARRDGARPARSGGRPGPAPRRRLHGARRGRPPLLAPLAARGYAPTGPTALLAGPLGPLLAARPAARLGLSRTGRRWPSRPRSGRRAGSAPRAARRWRAPPTPQGRDPGAARGSPRRRRPSSPPAAPAPCSTPLQVPGAMRRRGAGHAPGAPRRRLGRGPRRPLARSRRRREPTPPALAPSTPASRLPAPRRLQLLPKGPRHDRPLPRRPHRPRPLPRRPPCPSAPQKYFAVCEEKLGMVPNVLLAHAFAPEKLDAFSGLYNELMLAPSGLSKLEREMIAVVVSAFEPLLLLPGRPRRRRARPLGRPGARRDAGDELARRPAGRAPARDPVPSRSWSRSRATASPRPTARRCATPGSATGTSGTSPTSPGSST